MGMFAIFPFDNVLKLTISTAKQFWEDLESNLCLFVSFKRFYRILKVQMKIFSFLPAPMIESISEVQSFSFIYSQFQTTFFTQLTIQCYP